MRNKYDALQAFLDDFKKEVIKEVYDFIMEELEASYKPKKLYYNLKEVAHITGLTYLALKGRQRRGTLRVVIDGQIVLVHKDELNRLLMKLNRQRRA